MFNRARPDKETEGIIGREKEKTDRQREEEKKKAGKRISRGKTPPPSLREARKTLQDDSSKGSTGPQTQLSEAGFLAHKGLI